MCIQVKRLCVNSSPKGKELPVKKMKQQETARQKNRTARGSVSQPKKNKMIFQHREATQNVFIKRLMMSELHLICSTFSTLYNEDNCIKLWDFYCHSLYTTEDIQAELASPLFSWNSTLTKSIQSIITLIVNLFNWRKMELSLMECG